MYITSHYVDYMKKIKSELKFKIDKCVIKEWLHLQWFIILQTYPHVIKYS